MKALTATLLAGAVMMSAPSHGEESLSTALSDAVAEQSTQILERIEQSVSDELNVQFTALTNALAQQLDASQKSAPQDVAKPAAEAAKAAPADKP